jgi:hypothetical protein
MTNIFSTSELIKVIDEYYNAAVSTMHTQQKNRVIPKALLYTIGTTIIATVIYKSVKAVVPRQNSLDDKSTLSAFIKKEQEQEQTSTLSFNFLSTAINSLSNLLKYKKTVTKQQEIFFEDKYFKEYDEWIEAHPLNHNDDKNVIINAVEEQHKKECLENMYYSTVRETINDFYGDVIMCYDHATFSFAYYARTGNIPYKYLETISRKYMIETNAPREIHVDIRNEYKKAKDRTKHVVAEAKTTTSTLTTTDTATATDTKTTTDTTDTADTKTTTDIFVKLKSYNTASNLNLHTTTNDTTEKTHKFVSSLSADTSATNATEVTNNGTNKIIREKANRYSYRGKINDFAEHHNTFLSNRRKATAISANTTENTDTTTNTEKEKPAATSYAEFKKQMMKSV